MAEQHAQRIYPYLYVDDVRAYLEFLSNAFGFVTRMHHVEPDDPEHEHAETVLGETVVMIGKAAKKWGTISPKALPGLPGGIFAYVDDVDAHFRRARAAGATIEAEPQDKHWGDRMYQVRDPEGHQWYFATRGAAANR